VITVNTVFIYMKEVNVTNDTCLRFCWRSYFGHWFSGCTVFCCEKHTLSDV